MSILRAMHHTGAALAGASVGLVIGASVTGILEPKFESLRVWGDAQICLQPSPNNKNLCVSASNLHADLAAEAVGSLMWLGTGIGIYQLIRPRTKQSVAAKAYRK